MSLFDGLDDMFGDFDDQGRIKTGKHKAIVTEVAVEEDAGRVKVEFEFPALKAKRTNYIYLKSQKGEAVTKKCVGFASLQLKNAGLGSIKNGAQLKKAFGELLGKGVIVDVTNKPDSKYQNFFISDKAEVEREEILDGDVPF